MESTAPNTCSMMLCPISLLVLEGLLFTSTPPIMTNPLMMMRGDPGMMGTLRSFRSRPPMNGMTFSSTSKPSGTVMLTPTHEGEHRDDDLGPIDLGMPEIDVAATHDGDGGGLPADAPPALGPGTAHDADEPTSGLAPPRLLDGNGQVRQVGHDVLQVTPSAGLEGQADPVREFIQGDPPVDHMLAEQGDGPVPIGVSHPLRHGALIEAG